MTFFIIGSFIAVILVAQTIFCPAERRAEHMATLDAFQDVCRNLMRLPWECAKLAAIVYVLYLLNQVHG